MTRYAGACAGIACWASAAWASDPAAGGGSSALITPQFGTIFWTIVTFIALALLLKRFAWRPLLGAIEERERSIRESREQARHDREEAADLLSDQRSILEEARRERLEALEQGRKDAERLRAEILEEAKRQREHTVRQAEAQVQALLRQARSDLRSETADLAVQVASRLLARNLDDATHRRLVEEYLADLEQSAGRSRDLPS